MQEYRRDASSQLVKNVSRFDRGVAGKSELKGRVT